MCKNQQLALYMLSSEMQMHDLVMHFDDFEEILKKFDKPTKDFFYAIFFENEMTKEVQSIKWSDEYKRIVFGSKTSCL